MARPTIRTSTPVVTLAVTSQSPTDNTSITATGSPSARENRIYNIASYDERGKLNRVIKKRDCRFGGDHVNTVAQLETLI